MASDISSKDEPIPQDPKSNKATNISLEDKSGSKKIDKDQDLPHATIKAIQYLKQLIELH